MGWLVFYLHIELLSNWLRPFFDNCDATNWWTSMKRPPRDLHILFHISSVLMMIILFRFHLFRHTPSVYSASSFRTPYPSSLPINTSLPRWLKNTKYKSQLRANFLNLLTLSAIFHFGSLQACCLRFMPHHIMYWIPIQGLWHPRQNRIAACRIPQRTIDIRGKLHIHL